MKTNRQVKNEIKNNSNPKNLKPQNIELKKGTYTLTLILTKPPRLEKMKEKIQTNVNGKIKNISVNWHKYNKKNNEYKINFTIHQNPIILTTVIIGIAASGVFASGAWFFSEVNETSKTVLVGSIAALILFFPKIKKMLPI